MSHESFCPTIPTYPGPRGVFVPATAGEEPDLSELLERLQQMNAQALREASANAYLFSEPKDFGQDLRSIHCCGNAVVVLLF